jgi:hypothetical protein
LARFPVLRRVWTSLLRLPADGERTPRHGRCPGTHGWAGGAEVQHYTAQTTTSAAADKPQLQQHGEHIVRVIEVLGKFVLVAPPSQSRLFPACISSGPRRISPQ